MSTRRSDQANESERLRSGKTKPGVRAESYIDGRARRWSWGCKCGEWEDGYPTRVDATLAYREHKRTAHR